MGYIFQGYSISEIPEDIQSSESNKPQDPNPKQITAKGKAVFQIILEEQKKRFGFSQR